MSLFAVIVYDIAGFHRYIVPPYNEDQIAFGVQMLSNEFPQPRTDDDHYTIGAMPFGNVECLWLTNSTLFTPQLHAQSKN